ncbi:unnamed protein product [Lota lota]
MLIGLFRHGLLPAAREAHGEATAVSRGSGGHCAPSTGDTDEITGELPRPRVEPERRRWKHGSINQQ